MNVIESNDRSLSEEVIRVDVQLFKNNSSLDLVLKSSKPNFGCSILLQQPCSIVSLKYPHLHIGFLKVMHLMVFRSEY